MTPSAITRTLHDARAQWLAGERDAWARYAACCLHVETNRRHIPRPAPTRLAPDRPRRPQS